MLTTILGQMVKLMDSTLAPMNMAMQPSIPTTSFTCHLAALLAIDLWPGISGKICTTTLHLSSVSPANSQLKKRHRTWAKIVPRPVIPKFSPKVTAHSSLEPMVELGCSARPQAKNERFVQLNIGSGTVRTVPKINTNGVWIREEIARSTSG